MNRCPKCGVKIADDTDKCPLCYHVLERGEQSGTHMYPDAMRVTKRFRFLENLFFFLSLVAVAITVGINYTCNPDVPWSLILTLSLLYVNLVIKFAVAGKSGYMFKTFSLVVLAIVILLGIDFLTGYRGWSIDYVLPSGILLVDLLLFVLMLVNRRNWQSYMLMEIGMILASVIPGILLLVGIIQFPYLTLAAGAASLFLFLGTLILGDTRARTELKRRFYI